MFVTDFEALVNRLRFNNSLVFCLRNLYSVLTGTKLVNEQIFEEWFIAKAEELHLLKEVHYRYRVADDINSVFVRGSVGLNLVLLEDSPLGDQARAMCGTNRVPMCN